MYFLLAASLAALSLLPSSILTSTSSSFQNRNYQSNESLNALSTKPLNALSASNSKRYTSGLNDAAKDAGKLYFGTATDPVSFGDVAYMRVLNDTGDFGGLSVENAMKVCFLDSFGVA